MSQIPEPILEKIREAKEKQLKELDLSGWYTSVDQKLTQIPAEIFELVQLEQLKLSGHSITKIPDAISRLENLTFFDLSRNRLAVLPDAIGCLKNLTRLNLSFNELTILPETVGDLSALNVLNISFNQLIILPKSMARLSKLITLYLNSNDLTTLHEGIVRLRNLIELDLSDNHLTILPEEISQLPYLEYLDLSANPVNTPPPAIVFKGYKAIKDYFRQLATVGSDHLYEAKLLILGAGGAGKTTLMRKLKNPGAPMPRPDDMTEGIEVTRWEFPLSSDLIRNSANLSDKQTFRINIWDFGGQAIYHATHQFFLTKNSLYILMADNRLDDDSFDYWLKIVELLSSNSPLLIVKNEKQDFKRDINERQLREQYTNLQKILATNLATNRGLPEIIGEIKHQICGLPHVGITLPKTWTQVRETLETDPRNYIGLDEYLTICQRYGFTNYQDKMQLIGYLHDLGVCLHFKDDSILRKTIILNPEWGTDAVYKVLNNETVVDNKGRFSRVDLESIWGEEHYAGVQDELLQLMMRFKLCYQIPDSQDTYIAPQRLPAEQPDYNWPETNNLRLRYTYDKFMPKGLLTQFIVATIPMINQHYVWKSGVILEKDGAEAEIIEHYQEKEITIRIKGSNKKELLTIIIYELDKIHKPYQGLKYDKLIPCNCPGCKVSQEPYFYPFEVLRKFVNERRPFIMCMKTADMVEVLRLIDVIDFTPPLGLKYDLKRIRDLLTQGFSERELRQFCSDEPDFRSLYAELGEAAGIAHIADRMVSYAERKELFMPLLNWAKVTNLARYERFKPYMETISR